MPKAGFETTIWLLERLKRVQVQDSDWPDKSNFRMFISLKPAHANGGAVRVRQFKM
jgi:hypothetical protein